MKLGSILQSQLGRKTSGCSKLNTTGNLSTGRSCIGATGKGDNLRKRGRRCPVHRANANRIYDTACEPNTALEQKNRLLVSIHMKTSEHRLIIIYSKKSGPSDEKPPLRSLCEPFTVQYRYISSFLYRKIRGPKRWNNHWCLAILHLMQSPGELCLQSQDVDGFVRIAQHILDVLQEPLSKTHV